MLPVISQFFFYLGDARFQRGLINCVLFKLGLQLGRFVSQQPGFGIANVDLHHTGPPGYLSLPTQRPQLPANLRGQVPQPGEVSAHRLEFAQRFFFPTAVFENAGGFFNESASLLRGGPQHRVQLALAHNDVHFPAHAGI